MRPDPRWLWPRSSRQCLLASLSLCVQLDHGELVLWAWIGQALGQRLGLEAPTPTELLAPELEQLVDLVRERARQQLE
jgi:hypothetical protein